MCVVGGGGKRSWGNAIKCSNVHQRYTNTREGGAKGLRER